MRNKVSSMVLHAIFNDWALESDDRRLLENLGLEGAEGLCAIHVALGQIFAHNPEMATLWPTTPNRVLHKLSPIELIRRDGIEGLRRVRTLVEQSSW